MRAVRVEDGRATLTSIDRPTAGEGEVLVDVVASGICGSDLHLIDSGLVEGVVLGHEFAGTTPDGTYVAIEPFRTCGVCASCAAGHRNRCSSPEGGIGIGSDGGMAEQIAVPAPSLVPLPSGLPIADASLVEPLAVAVHAVHRAGVSPTDRVVVVGAGAIGLATGVVAAATGAEVDVVARHDAQRLAVDPLGLGLDIGDGYDVAFDAVGSTAALAQSVQLTRIEGVVGIVGTFWDQVAMDASVCLKEVELVASMMYCRSATGRDVDAAAALLAARPAIADALITHRLPLDAAEEAFTVAADRAGGAIKVVLEP